MREIHCNLSRSGRDPPPTTQFRKAEAIGMRRYRLRQADLGFTVFSCCKFRHLTHFVLVFSFAGILAQNREWRTDRKQKFCRKSFLTKMSLQDSGLQ
jgi:hypothetical protein